MVTAPRRQTASECGTTLLEALVSLALGLVLLSAMLPLLVAGRDLAQAVSARSGILQAGRAARFRLMLDARRAGFGTTDLPGAVALDAVAGTLHLAFLSGGFRGGVGASGQGQPPGEMMLEKLADLQEGDEVMLVDRRGRRHVALLQGLDRGARHARLQPPPAFAVDASRGSTLFRIERRRWDLEAQGLRRDGQAILETGVTGRLQLAGDASGLPALLEGGSLQPVTGDPLHLVLDMGTTAVAPGRPALHWFDAVRLPCQQAAAHAGSPLP